MNLINYHFQNRMRCQYCQSNITLPVKRALYMDCEAWMTCQVCQEKGCGFTYLFNKLELITARADFEKALTLIDIDQAFRFSNPMRFKLSDIPIGLVRSKLEMVILKYLRDCDDLILNWDHEFDKHSFHVYSQVFQDKFSTPIYSHVKVSEFAPIKKRKLNSPKEQLNQPSILNEDVQYSHGESNDEEELRDYFQPRKLIFE